MIGSYQTQRFQDLPNECRRTFNHRSHHIAYFCTMLIAGLVVVSHAIPASAQCKTSDRWPVKTLTDPDAATVKFDNIQTATVEELALLPSIETSSATVRQPSERTVYQVRARAIAYRIEADGDIHLVLKDLKSDSVIVAEIPNSKCPVISDSRYASAFSDAGAWINKEFGTPGESFHFLAPQPVLVVVTGTAFFEPENDPRLTASNHFELHPVLSIVWGD